MKLTENQIDTFSTGLSTELELPSTQFSLPNSFQTLASQWEKQMSLLFFYNNFSGLQFLDSFNPNFVIGVMNISPLMLKHHPMWQHMVN